MIAAKKTSPHARRMARVYRIAQRWQVASWRTGYAAATSQYDSEARKREHEVASWFKVGWQRAMMKAVGDPANAAYESLPCVQDESRRFWASLRERRRT